MTDPDRSLDRLEQLLDGCLGRIEAEAERVCAGEEGADPEGVSQVFEDGTAELDDLMSRLLDGMRPGPVSSDINEIARTSLEGLLAELEFPVVARLDLADDPLPASGSPQPLQAAVRRALFLAASYAGRGGEVDITTRAEDGQVVFELTARGGADFDGLVSRCSTLDDFVRELRGRFAAGVDQSSVLFLAIEFQHPVQA